MKQTTKYDCTQDVKRHKVAVTFWLNDLARQLDGRAVVHDDSKLQEPEKSCFDEWTPKLKEFEFGGDEYKAALAKMGEGLKHHYESNSHHPEHYQNGINGMTLADLVEMFCDWLAAAEAKNVPVDMDYLISRFGISEQLASILINSLRDQDLWNRTYGVPVVDFTPEKHKLRNEAND